MWKLSGTWMLAFIKGCDGSWIWWHQGHCKILDRILWQSITPFLAFLGHMLISLIAAMHRRSGSMSICTRKNQRDSSSSPLCLDLVTSSVPQSFLLAISLSSHSWKANNWATYGSISPCQKSKIFSYNAEGQSLYFVPLESMWGTQGSIMFCIHADPRRLCWLTLRMLANAVKQDARNLDAPELLAIFGRETESVLVVDDWLPPPLYDTFSYYLCSKVLRQEKKPIFFIKEFLVIHCHYYMFSYKLKSH